MKLLTFLFILSLLSLAAVAVLAADLSTWSGGAAAFPSGEFDIHATTERPLFTLDSARPSSVVFSDARGRPIFTIDTEKRAIIVPDDVDVNATARLVLEAMGPYLRQVTGGAK